MTIEDVAQRRSSAQYAGRQANVSENLSIRNENPMDSTASVSCPQLPFGMEITPIVSEARSWARSMMRSASIHGATAEAAWLQRATQEIAKKAHPRVAESTRTQLLRTLLMQALEADFEHALAFILRLQPSLDFTSVRGSVVSTFSGSQGRVSSPYHSIRFLFRGRNHRKEPHCTTPSCTTNALRWNNS